jgi:hypothetical protein
MVNDALQMHKRAKEIKGEALPTSGMASARLKELTFLREGRRAVAARSDGLRLAAADLL